MKKCIINNNDLIDLLKSQFTDRIEIWEILTTLLRCAMLTRIAL